MFSTYPIEWRHQLPRHSNTTWIGNQTNTYMEHWWNDTGRENLKYCDKYQFNYYISAINLILIDLGSGLIEDKTAERPYGLY
jgi:hypothetical protein